MIEKEELKKEYNEYREKVEKVVKENEELKKNVGHTAGHTDGHTAGHNDGQITGCGKSFECRRNGGFEREVRQ